MVIMAGWRHRLMMIIIVRMFLFCYLLIRHFTEHAKLYCSAGKRDRQVFLPFAVSNRKISGRDLVLYHRCRYACTPPHPKKRIQPPLERPQVVSDDRFDTTDPTGASTKKHGCLLSRPVESSAQVGKSKKEGAQISLHETTMDICLWQNSSFN